MSRISGARAGIAALDHRTLVWIALVTLYLVWGSTYLAIRIAVESIPPFAMASVRFLIAGALLYAVTIRRGDTVGDRPGRKEWRDSAIVGGALLLGGMGLVAVGEVTVPSGIAALIIASLPLWIALLGRVFLGDRLTVPVLVGILIGFGGVALLVAPTGGVTFDPFGIAVLLLSPISWAAGSLYSRNATLPQRPLVATAMQMLCGGAILGVASLLTGELGRIDLSAITTASIAAVVYLILVGSLVGFTCYVWLLRNAPVTTVTTYAYVNPVVAFILGAIVLGEPIGPRTVVSGAIIVGAVALIITAQGRHRPVTTTPEAEA